jgi:plasmid stability protein
MLATCIYVIGMGKMIQLRNVPDELHRKLKARAAMAGMSLSDYLLHEIRKTAERPTVEELLERLKRLTSVEVRESPADVLRADRERRARR